MQSHSKSKVCYYYDSDIGNYYYGQGHPMKPHRMRMTHNLLLNYGLYRKMEVYRPHKATQDEMTKFHSDDYIKFLRSIRPDNMTEYSKLLQRFNVGEDCPVFDGELFIFFLFLALTGAQEVTISVCPIGLKFCQALNFLAFLSVCSHLSLISLLALSKLSLSSQNSKNYLNLSLKLILYQTDEPLKYFVLFSD